MVVVKTETARVELLIEVETLAQAEILRGVRNVCREFMTRNQNYISQEQQIKWFESLDRSIYQPYLVYTNDSQVLGYCVIALIDGLPWLTAGLLPEHRGRGLGGRVFQTMMNWCWANNYPCVMLDVLKTNVSAHGLYLKLGFVDVEETDRVWVMRCDRP